MSTQSSIDTDYTNNQSFQPGDRIELHPSCDLWMRGARYGTVKRVLSVGRLVVKMDHPQVRRLVTTTVQSVRPTREVR